MFFNNKLYVQFYPIETEEDKNECLNSNYIKIYKMVRDMGHIASNELYVKIKEYGSKMKPTVSFLGTPKYKNIAYNQFIAHEMSKDKTISFISKEVPIIESLMYKLTYNELEKITIEELNHILEYANTMKRKNMCTIILGILSLLFLCWVLMR